MNFILDIFFNLIFKQKCLICGCSKDNSYLCKSCSKLIKFSTVFTQNKIEDVEIFSAFLYEEKIKKLIQTLKFKHKKDVSKILANFLWEYFKKLNFEKDFLIVPVPSHYTRVLERGYCHINEICREFSRLSNMKLNKDILKKVKKTKPQFKLNKKERVENIKNSFGLNLKKYNGDKILLIDDITTTGATLEEILKLFKGQNINNIIVLTVAKTVLNNPV